MRVRNTSDNEERREKYKQKDRKKKEKKKQEKNECDVSGTDQFCHASKLMHVYIYMNVFVIMCLLTFFEVANRALPLLVWFLYVHSQ